MSWWKLENYSSGPEIDTATFDNYFIARQLKQTIDCLMRQVQPRLQLVDYKANGSRIPAKAGART